MHINLPNDVEKILSILHGKGHSAYVVGGCVRDTIMKTSPNDWDICTSALPQEIMQCFAGFPLIETGLQHGTITVILNHEPYEITTFRIDGNYEDNRRPSSVEFTPHVEDDLARRDFTINAIAYSPKEGLVDPYNGVGAIGEKMICCVGNPEERFQEDALRIMRGLRFSSVLGFAIEESTSAALLKNKELLENIAIERINTEFCKLLLGKNVEKVLLEYREVIGRIIPEIKPMFDFAQNNPYHIYSVWGHTVKAIGAAQKDRMIRLAVFFHDMGKPQCYTEEEGGVGHFYGHGQESAKMAESVLKRMRFDKETVAAVRELVYYHDTEIKASSKAIRRWLNRMGAENLRRLLQVKQADTLGQAPAYQPARLALYADFTKRMEEVLEQGQCFSLKDLAINGKDLTQAGIEPGPEIGKILHQLLDLVMEEELENTKESLLGYLEKS